MCYATTFSIHTSRFVYSFINNPKNNPVIRLSRLRTKKETANHVMSPFSTYIRFIAMTGAHTHFSKRPSSSWPKRRKKNAFTCCRTSYNNKSHPTCGCPSAREPTSRVFCTGLLMLSLIHAHTFTHIHVYTHTYIGSTHGTVQQPRITVKF